MGAARALLPPASQRGRPRQRSLRVIVEAILYIAWSGIQWRAPPAQFPPFTTVQSYFYVWRDTGLLHRLVQSWPARHEADWGSRRRGRPA